MRRCLDARRRGRRADRGGRVNATRPTAGALARAEAVLRAACGDRGRAGAVLGKGSNMLVSDGGFAGVVLRLGRGYRWSARDGNRLAAGGAMPLPALSGVALPPRPSRVR